MLLRLVQSTRAHAGAKRPQCPALQQPTPPLNTRLSSLKALAEGTIVWRSSWVGACSDSARLHRVGVGERSGRVAGWPGQLQLLPSVPGTQQQPPAMIALLQASRHDHIAARALPAAHLTPGMSSAICSRRGITPTVLTVTFLRRLRREGAQTGGWGGVGAHTSCCAAVLR